MAEITEKETVALHEAGHCFCMWACGLRIKSVTIQGPLTSLSEESERTPFYCVAYFEKSTFDQSVKYFKERIGVDFAGPIIEKEKNGALSIGAIREIEKAMLRLCFFEDPELMQMAEDAKRLLSKYNGDEASQHFFNLYADKFGEILKGDRAQKAIDALAKELLKRGSLTGFEAIKILERAHGFPYPKRAKPASDHDTGFDMDRSLENTIESMGHIISMGLNLLRKYMPKDEYEEDLLEKANEETVRCIFGLKSIKERLEQLQS